MKKNLFFRYIFLCFFVQGISQVDSLKLYPYTFNTSVSVHYYLAHNDTATITVYSTFGNIIKVFFSDTFITAGAHTFNYNTSSLANGNYLFSLVTKTDTARKIGSKNNANAVESFSSEQRISVYPNPCNGKFTLECSKEIGAILIYDEIGQIVFDERTKEKIKLIDLTRQATGIYFVKVNNQYLKLIRQ